MEIKKLTSEHWDLYKKIRLEALEESPHNFVSTFEDEVTKTEDDIKDHLIHNDIFDCFSNDVLVGTIEYNILPQEKVSHKIIIYGVYVSPESRGNKIAENLLSKMLAQLEGWVKILKLTCLIDNLKAVNLYKKFGFTVYAIEKRSLKIGDKYCDEYLLSLDLDKV